MYTYCVDGLIYLCLADNAVRTEIAYAFLDTVKGKFSQKYTPEQTAQAVTYGISFNDDLKTIMEDCNTNPEPDKAKAMIAELSDTKNLVAENLSISHSLISLFLRQGAEQRYPDKRGAS